MAVMRRVVLAGLGSIRQRHARLLRERTDVLLELFEPSAEALRVVRAEAGHLRVHSDLDQMLASSPDVVWIASPTRHHAAQAIASLRAGAHVFCEKPMSERPEDAAEIRRVAEASGRILNTGFVLRFAPSLIELRRLLREGRLGNLVHIHARVGTYVTLANSKSRYQAANPGSLFLDYSHQPDLFHWLTGLIPSEVTAVGLSAGQMPHMSDPNVAVVTYRYPENLLATLHLNYVQMPERHEYEIVGDQGWALVQFAEGRIQLGSREESAVREVAFPHERDDLFRAQHQAFFEALDCGGSPSSPPRDSEIAVSVCSATMHAWRTGKPVAIEPPA